MIAALSAVVTLATGVVSLRAQLLPSSTQRGATSGSPVPPPSSGGTDCGRGLHAGPNTSCPFAQNVRNAYNTAPGTTASVRVFSPVTRQTYTMSCAPAGSGVTCSGANNASATWSG